MTIRCVVVLHRRAFLSRFWKAVGESPGGQAPLSQAGDRPVGQHAMGATAVGHHVGVRGQAGQMPFQRGPQPLSGVARPGGSMRVDVRLEQDTVWLTQRQVSELFATSIDNVSLH